MGIVYNTSAVRTGIVLDLDAANRKSYSGTGTTWTDISASTNDATLQNGVTYSSDNGGCFVFDGSDDLIEVNNASELNPSEITIIAWVNPNSLNNGCIVAKDDTTNYKLRLRSDGTCDFLSYTYTPRGGTTTNQLNANTNYSTNTWTCIAATGDASGLTIYKDGEFVANNSTAYDGSVTSGPLYIGAKDPFGFASEHFDGKISVVQIFYDNVLTATDIRRNFNALRGRYGI